MKTSEAEELYANLNKLLADICMFLVDGDTFKCLSVEARKTADELIERSKSQIQAIAQAAATLQPSDTQEDSGADAACYVDMERRSLVEIKNIYSSVDEGPSTVLDAVATVPILKRNEICPFSDYPPRSLVDFAKKDILHCKVKIILNFEKLKRVLCIVKQNWLLMYCSEKDSKPWQSFNLMCHKALPIVNNYTIKVKEFELVNIIDNKKVFHFVTNEHKEMLQWIAELNRCRENISYNNSINMTDEDSENNYDSIVSLQKKLSETYKHHKTEEQCKKEDQEVIYEEPFPTKSTDSLPIVIQKQFSLPPDLPKRPPKSSSTASSSPDNSFSDPEEDVIYEIFEHKVPPMFQTENRTEPRSRPKAISAPIVPMKSILKPPVPVRRF